MKDFLVEDSPVAAEKHLRCEFYLPLVSFLRAGRLRIISFSALCDKALSPRIRSFFLILV